MTLVKLDELTYPKIQELLDDGVDTLLWPVGTMEAHGRHAPVGTDNYCAEEIAWRLADRLNWPVAPTLNYGVTSGLIAYPGGVRIPKPQYEELVQIILSDFLRMGFKRIIVVNGHGGNTESLGKVVKDMIAEDRGKRHLVIVDWWYIAVDALKEVYGRPGGHAALDETAAIVAYRPELIDKSAYRKEDMIAFTPGVISAPYSAAVLLYDEGDASPDFDEDKANLFMDKVIEKIDHILRHEVELFERSFRSREE